MVGLRLSFQSKKRTWNRMARFVKALIGGRIVVVLWFSGGPDLFGIAAEDHSPAKRDLGPEGSPPDLPVPFC